MIISLLITKGMKLMSKKRKSIFDIFDELSENFVDGIREGLENFSNLIGNVVELAGKIDTIDIIENKMKKVEIESEDTKDNEDKDVIKTKILE